MAPYWNIISLYVLSCGVSFFARSGDRGSIACPVVAVQPQETPPGPIQIATASTSRRSEQQHHLVGVGRMRAPDVPNNAGPRNASRCRRKQRHFWSLPVVALGGKAFKSALRDLSYCPAEIASADNQQSSVMANRMAFGNVLRPTENTEHGEALQAENDASVEAVMEMIESDGWEHVTTTSGVTVARKFISALAVAPDSSAVDAQKAAKFACVKAVGTLNADASKLYKLFLDNERVHEYNDNCRHVRDLERLSPDTRISWAATPRYGPIKARDFVTVVHHRTLPDGTMVVLNRAVEHPAVRRGSKYVRAEILIATNIMRPNRTDPTKTDFISVTHINPGGIVDNAIGATIANKLCAKAPVNLLVSLERCANSAQPETALRPS